MFFPALPSQSIQTCIIYSWFGKNNKVIDAESVSLSSSLSPADVLRFCSFFVHHPLLSFSLLYFAVSVYKSVWLCHGKGTKLLRTDERGGGWLILHDSRRSVVLVGFLLWETRTFRSNMYCRSFLFSIPSKVIQSTRSTYRKTLSRTPGPDNHHHRGSADQHPPPIHFLLDFPFPPYTHSSTFSRPIQLSRHIDARFQFSVVYLAPPPPSPLSFCSVLPSWKIGTRVSVLFLFSLYWLD